MYYTLTASVTIVALVFAASQFLHTRQLQQALDSSVEQQATLQRYAEQLESNLQSAGVQMQNLSHIAQEASERAATCEPAD